MCHDEKVSTANLVPETTNAPAKRPRDVMEDMTSWRLLKTGMVRFRYADGFSFARALAYQVVLTVIPALIVVVALAQRIGQGGGFAQALRDITNTVAPGPAGEVIRIALEQGSQGTVNLAVIITGAVAVVVSGASAMGQLQRAASRVYGVEDDRPTLRRYLVATGLMVSVGVMLVMAFILLTVGESISSVLSDYSSWWTWGRWPVGLLLTLLALAWLFKVAPNRSQPGLKWLMTGSVIAVIAWAATTGLLALYLSASGSFGETYGPLAGIIGFMLWAYLSSIAVLTGLAYAAQLEALRAGAPQPRSTLKEALSSAPPESRSDLGHDHLEEDRSGTHLEGGSGRGRHHEGRTTSSLE